MNKMNEGQRRIFSRIGASNHSDDERPEHDYYRTEPKRTEFLMDLETFDQNVWEPCCGEGHMAKVLEAHGYTVRSTDLIDRGYGQGGVNFLEQTDVWDGDIITNPPYKNALDIVRHAVEIVGDGHKVAMFLKLLFLEGKKRGEFFKDHPPKVVYVSRNRLKCLLNGQDNAKWDPAVAYAWFIWEKGFKGEPVIRWFN